MLFLNYCSSSTVEGNWFAYYNFSDNAQKQWKIKTIPQKFFSIEEFNSLDLEKLDLEDFKLIVDETEKEELLDIIPYTKWTIDSSSYEPIGLESPINQEEWLYLEKKRLKNEINLYALGNIEFVSGINSVLIVRQDSSDRYYQLILLSINIRDNSVVSIVELGEYGDFISLSTQSVNRTIYYNKRKRKFNMHEVRRSLFMDEICTTNEDYYFRIETDGSVNFPFLYPSLKIGQFKIRQKVLIMSRRRN